MGKKKYVVKLTQKQQKKLLNLTRKGESKARQMTRARVLLLSDDNRQKGPKSDEQIADILDVNIFRQRTEGPIFIGGIFISYSHEDSDFVDKLHKSLKGAGAPVWLDRHDMLAGSMENQVFRAIRLQDIVITVLSESSIESDWVEAELEAARQKEKAENRDVLCPVALDDSWQKKVESATPRSKCSTASSITTTGRTVRRSRISRP